ncbi:MAG: PEGA domain-containing protein [Myxococcales bacterium]|nr:MAG: PEGA domain-containing protein [Myxococcales bacterium]
MGILARVLVAAALVAVGVSPRPAAAGQDRPAGVVVWRLEAKTGVTEKDIDLISGFVTSQVERHASGKVISEADIRTLLKGEQTRQQCGVDDPSCLAEIGDALGVAEAVSGELGKVGNFWLLNLRRIDTRHAEVIKRSSRNIAGAIDDVLVALPAAVAELFGETGAVAPAPVAPVAPAPPPPPSPPPVEPGMLAVVSTPPGAAVEIDGEAKGATPLETALPPGEHALAATLDGYATEKRDVTLAAGERMDVALTLAAEKPMHPYTMWGHIAFWPGLALAAFGGVATWQAKAAADDYNAATAPDAAKDAEAANTRWTGGAIAGYVLGGALMATGATLWILGAQADDGGAAVSAGPTPDGSGAGVFVGGRW